MTEYSTSRSPSPAVPAARTDRYVNPIYPRDFPDPFILRFNGRYYAYSTTPQPTRSPEARVFPMLSSRDLVHWEEHGYALGSLGLPGVDAYWAPEVAYHEGRFYMYYAAGNDANPDHHLRVATAEHPLGPWHDSGRNLTPHEIFAIDAHPFRDPRDGQWYLFYARDRLESPYAGTGVAVDRLVTMEELAGEPTDVLRPYAEWQLFEKQRAIKAGLDWYTIEGPFVLLHEDQYVCFYSGGRWENPNYGVGYATAPTPLGPWRDDAGQEGPVVLTTLPDQVIGPGHNSIVLGPDLQTQYVVYHGWDARCTARYPRIDRLQWIDGRPHCDGPTVDPQPAPRLADVAVWFDEGMPGPEWDAVGDWTLHADGVAGTEPNAMLTLQEPQSAFVAEISLRGVLPALGAGVRIGDLRITLEPGRLSGNGHAVSLDDRFHYEAWHRLFIERREDAVLVTLDEFPTLQLPQPTAPARISLCPDSGAVFGHFALTRLQG